MLHQLLVIGEATKRLTPAFRSEHDDVPWDDIAGMRDRLIHRYHEVDLEAVWTTAQRDVPALLDRLEPHLPRR